MSTAMKRLALALLLILAGGTATSGADYTSTSRNPQAFTAAADFGVHATLTDPGSPLRGSVALSATASETQGGTIASVAIQRSAAGADSWTTICTDESGPPYTCSWDTTAVANGQYDLRARATNGNGYSSSSPVVASRLVDNAAPSVTIESPGSWVRGTITLRGTAGDTGGSGLASVAYQYKLSSAGTWSPACSASAAPYECSFDTSSLGDGQDYDFRAVATDGAGNTASAVATGVKPDNAVPNGGTLTDPGTNLRGTVPLSFSGSDAHSGVASIAVQYAPSGTTSWSTACVDTSSPHTSCSWDTPPLDDVYSLRAVVTDTAGNNYATAPIAARRVDNGLPTVSLTAPASPMSGTITLSSDASDTGSGVASVTTQYSAAGAGAWANACAPDTVSPYSCTANSTGVPDGLYDFRAAATDAAGNVAYSTLTAQRIDNYVPSASDVQTANGGGTPGVIQTGDSITLTYSEPIDASSIVAGWDGSGSQSVHVRFTHAGAGDRLLFYNAANSVTIPLATGTGVDLRGDYVPNTNATYAATLTSGASGAAFTVTLGARTAGSVNAAAPAAATMQWSPSSAARDFAGKQCTTTVRAETGAADAEF